MLSTDGTTRSRRSSYQGGVRHRPDPADGRAEGYNGLGSRIRTRRLGLGMSQEALAAPTFTKSYISAVERDKVRPSLKALHLLAHRLEVPLEQLIAGTDLNEWDNDSPALRDRWLGAMLRVTATIVDADDTLAEIMPRFVALRARPDFVARYEQGHYEAINSAEWFAWVGEWHSREVEFKIVQARKEGAMTEYHTLRAARPDLLPLLDAYSRFIPQLPVAYGQPPTTPDEE